MDSILFQKLIHNPIQDYEFSKNRIYFHRTKTTNILYLTVTDSNFVNIDGLFVKNQMVN
jgi:hypothetical protein